MLTLKEIAELTNVSVSTVSRVLSNKGNIGEDTRQKVLAAVQEMMYSPGAVAQAKRAIANNIALYIPSKGEYYQDDPMSSIDLRSLAEEFQKAGDTTQFVYRANGNDAAELIRKFQEHEIDGIVLIDPPRDPTFIQHIVDARIPHIVTNGHFRNHAHHVIDFNNYDGARQVTQYLLDNGHRQIGIIAGPETHMVSHNRLDGVRDALAAAGITLESLPRCFQQFSLEGGYHGFLELHAQNKPLTAIIAFSDFIAMGAMKAIREQGLRIPDDISIVGFDNLKLSDFCVPALTTVNRFSDEISALIVNTLDDLIRFQRNIEQMTIILKTDLVIRESVKRLA